MLRRAAGDAVTRLRRVIVERSPEWARRSLGPAAMAFDALVLDHGLLRLVSDNRHRLSADAWRSAQPGPRRLRAWAGRGIRTIVNLRGRGPLGTYWLERDACSRLGLTLVDFRLRSYEAPSREQLHRARALLTEVEYPILIHCKSGADRTGLMGVLYRVVRESASIRDARRELSLRYGHLRCLDAGILDHFLDCYQADTDTSPMEFFEWVDRRYDRDAVIQSFRARSWRRRFLGPGGA